MKLAAAALLLIVAPLAHAQINLACATADEAWAAQSLADLKGARDMLPAVPPNEVKTLEAEDKRFKAAPTVEAMNRILREQGKRPYYILYRTRQVIDDLTEDFQGILEPAKSAAPNKDTPELAKAYLAAYALHDIQSYADLADSLRKQGAGLMRSRGMSEKDLSLLGERSLQLRDTIGSYIACKVSKGGRK